MQLILNRKTAYIGIGSNLGDPEENCLKSIDRIRSIRDCSIKGISPFYATEPVGVRGHDWYVNGVVSVITGLSARSLLEELLTVEEDFGRVRKGHWEPRVIDLDIIFFGSDIIDEEGLIVPHPLMHERRFVIAPMADLAPEMIHPLLGKKMSELLREIPGNVQIVKRMR